MREIIYSKIQPKSLRLQDSALPHAKPHWCANIADATVVNDIDAN